MAYRRDPVSLEYDDDDILDRIMPFDVEAPSYPYGCRFEIDEDDLEAAAGEAGKPGDVLKFQAMAEVTSVYQGQDDSRVELRITDFAGEDGKFVQIKEMPDGADEDETWRRFGCICLSKSELEKMGLEADAERGDLIHLIGEAELISTSRSERNGDVACLQVTRLTYAEDESTEGED